MSQYYKTERQIESLIKGISYSLMNKYYKTNTHLHMIGVLKACVPFFADLMREMSTEITVDFIGIKSFENGIRTAPSITQPLTINCVNKSVLIVDTICATGYTLRRVIQEVKKDNPYSIETVVLFDRPQFHKIPIVIDYPGLTVEHNKFLVGYGLEDAKGKYRNLKYVLQTEENDVT